MIYPIVAYGHSVLRKECDEINEGEDVSVLIEDMFQTMYAAKGVGLAAPQIGKSIRLFVVDATPFSEEEPENKIEKIDFKRLKSLKKVFINPIIEDQSGEKWPFSEGCLSIPGIREDVIRESEIKISYFNQDWEFKEEIFKGVGARIIQHEYDHIEGVLFTDYLNPLKKRLLKRKFTDISKGKVDVDYRMKFLK
ncbi:MAG: peptide deformylase [Flavobacteriales bacterium]|jgi:peptide deformylase|nr:peptide deformylase [Flavobacteriales bacterium]